MRQFEDIADLIFMQAVTQQDRVEPSLSRVQGRENGLSSFQDFHEADCSRHRDSHEYHLLRMAIRVIEEDGGVRFGVKVVPGSSRDRIVGELGDVLKIAVRAPPQGGKANDAVVALLSERLGVPVRCVSVVRGHGNPRKEIRVARVSALDVSQRLGLSAPAG